MTVSPDSEMYSGDTPQFDEDLAINEITAELLQLDVPVEEVYGIIDILTRDPSGVYEGQTNKYSYTVVRAPNGRYILKPFQRLPENGA